MAKKTAGKTGKTKAKPFQKGNDIGKSTRFKSGNPGGPGRPPALQSPRAMLKRYAQEIAPKRLRDMLAKMVPGSVPDDMSWAEVVALAHLIQAAKGEMRAIEAVYKQIDDHGAEVLQLEHKDPPSERVAKQLKKLRERRQILEAPPGQPG